MTDFLERHSKTAIIISIICAILGIGLVVFIYTSLSAKNTSNETDNRIAAEFFVPQTVTTAGENLDGSFAKINETASPPSDFWDNMGILCGDKILSYSNGNLFISSTTDSYFVRQYQLPSRGAVTAFSLNGILNVVYCDQNTGRLSATDLSGNSYYIGNIYCAAGENLGSVFSDGKVIYYVDRDKRTVCSVNPDGSDITDISVTRVSAYFVANKTFYYANEKMLSSKKTYGGDSVWLYECPHPITDISATDENIYMGWMVNTNVPCGARLNFKTNSYTPLSGNQVEKPKKPVSSENVTSLTNDEVPENLPDLDY